MNMVHAPKGFAHGFQTLDDNCQILYCHTEFYKPKLEGGFRYDSPVLNIAWPEKVTDISNRDAKLDCFELSFEGI
jgi:dTDP-4-dehydrorhamnose 3,5-epimerase